MKIVNTPIFNKMIARAIRKIKRDKVLQPPDGYMFNIIDEFSKKGKWLVEYVHDTRIFPKPYIAAFFFRTHRAWAASADSVKYKQL